MASDTRTATRRASPRRGWAGAVIAAASLLTIAAALSACGGAHPPPSPTAAFRPALVGIVARVTSLDCGVSRIELEGGERIDLDLVGSSLNLDTPCPGSDTPSAWRAFGTNDTDTAKHRLFFTGTDEAGAAWYGWARPSYDCGKGVFGIGMGAWDAGDAFHLATGVVLDKADDFEAADPPRDYVPTDGFLCVNATGEVVSTWEPQYG